MVDFHSSRPGHDLRYSLSGEKMKQLGWQPSIKLTRRIQQVVQWSLKIMNGLKCSYMKNKVILTSVLIFFLSFLNFQFNLFNVVSEFRFNYFQVESEQFVLDGFLNHSINDKPLQLGQFSRPSIDMFNDGEKYKPREWFTNEFIEGEFWEYKSHFGLQRIIFNFFNGNLLLVQSLASFLFSLTITILFIQLCRLHSFNFGLIFIASLVLNPWITPIARNSYFLVFIYLVPLVISYYFSEGLTIPTLV